MCIHCMHSPLRLIDQLHCCMCASNLGPTEIDANSQIDMGLTDGDIAELTVAYVYVRACACVCVRTRVSACTHQWQMFGSTDSAHRREDRKISLGYTAQPTGVGAVVAASRGAAVGGGVGR